MKSIKLVLLCIGLTIGQFSFSSSYMHSNNDASVTVESITKESYISPEMQWTVASFNKPEFFIINKTTGAVQNMPSVESVLSSINLQIQNGMIGDSQKESIQNVLRTMLEATEIAFSIIDIQAAYEDTNATQFIKAAAAFRKDQLTQGLNQQKSNIQITQTRLNALNPQSYVSWMFGSSSTSSAAKSSAINLQPVSFDQNSETISIPAYLMDSIIKLNDYKQKSDATIAANLLFKECFIAQQQHRAHQIPLNLKNPLSAENYIYNNFPSIYNKYNNKYPICELALKQGMQARIPLLHIRQAIQTALSIANKKSASNLGSFLPQYLTSYLDGVVSELMKYDNYVAELCKNPSYGATPADIAKSAEWSTISKVAAGVAIVGATAAAAYYFRNEISDAGKQTYDQTMEGANWLTGKTAQLEKDKAAAEKLAEEKAIADQKVLDDQKAIAEKEATRIAQEKEEATRIVLEKEKEVARIAQEKEAALVAEQARIEAEEKAEIERDAANRKYLEEKATMLKEKASSMMQTIKENMPFVSKKVVEQEKEKQDAIEKTAPIAAEQMQFVQDVVEALPQDSEKLINRLNAEVAPTQEKAAAIATAKMLKENTSSFMEQAKEKAGKLMEQADALKEKAAEYVGYETEKMKLDKEKPAAKTTTPTTQNASAPAPAKETKEQPKRVFGAAGLTAGINEALLPGAEEYSEDLGKYDKDLAEKLAALKAKKAKDIIYSTTIEDDAKAAKETAEKLIKERNEIHNKKLAAEKNTLENAKKINDENIKLLTQQNEEALLRNKVLQAEQKRNAAYAKSGKIVIEDRITNQTVDDIAVANAKKALKDKKSIISTTEYELKKITDKQKELNKATEKLAEETKAAGLKTSQKIAETKELFALAQLQKVENAKENKATQQQITQQMKQSREEAQKLADDFKKQMAEIDKDQKLSFQDQLKNKLQAAKDYTTNLTKEEKELNSIPQANSDSKKVESSPKISSNLTRRQRKDLEADAQQAQIKKDAASKAWLGALGWTGVEALTPKEQAAYDYMQAKKAKAASAKTSTPTPQPATAKKSTPAPQITTTNDESDDAESKQKAAVTPTAQPASVNEISNEAKQTADDFGVDYN